jgi:indole-3-glycerol phosphate synthase
VILDEIVAQKRLDVAARAERANLAELQTRLAQRGPTRSLWHALDEDGVGVMAEIKRRSPSAGVFADDVDPAAWAARYQAGGAIAISVLTDEPFFGGTHADLVAARAATDLPVLQKDFVINDYQIFEAAAAGADAVLLITGLTIDQNLDAQITLVYRLGMEALVEVHTEEELDEALLAGARIIGINNRNLREFTTDLAVTEELCKLIPEEITIVSESGVHTAHDVERLAAAGVSGVLVGESIMRSSNPVEQLRMLVEAGE